jgi:hypothetical protein
MAAYKIFKSLGTLHSQFIVKIEKNLVVETEGEMDQPANYHKIFRANVHYNFELSPSLNLNRD